MTACQEAGLAPKGRNLSIPWRACAPDNVTLDLIVAWRSTAALVRIAQGCTLGWVISSLRDLGP